MDKPKYYFTNPTADRHKARKVLLRIIKETNLRLINPFYDEQGNPTEEVRMLDRGLKPKVSTPEIVAADLKLIHDCQGVIAWITNRTCWGSIQECCIAYREFKLPVYIIWDEGSRGTCEHCKGANPNTPGYPWAVDHCTQTFGTLQGFIDFAKKKWGEKDGAKEHNRPEQGRLSTKS